MEIQVGVSNRHIHLTQEDLEKLFGKGFQLEIAKPLVQQGEFASTSFVTIKTEKNSINKVRVLGPIRDYTQVEVSKTDSFLLGINPPIRNSGDLNNSETLTIIGPNGEITKNNCCIIPNRHIHISNEDLKKYNLDKDKEYSIKINGEKGGIIDHVKIKTSEKYAFELHIDTDDANSHLLKSGDIVEII